MPRRAREEAPDAIHHVVAQGNGGMRIVRDDTDRRLYLRRFATIVDDFGWIVHTDCLMDTHHHVVIETPEPTLGCGMQRHLGGYAWLFNKRHRRNGHLFYGPFWSRRVEDEAHFFAACLYVVLNPVAAGVCAHPREWSWSSYRAIASGRGTERLMGMFGPEAEEAVRCYRTAVYDATALIRERRAVDARGLLDVVTSVAERELLSAAWDCWLGLKPEPKPELLARAQARAGVPPERARA